MINPIINFNPNFSSLAKTKQAPKAEQAVTNVLTNPIQRPKLPQPTTMMALLYNNISFTGKKEDLVRSFGHVSCPCCGTKMLTNNDMDKIKKDLGREDSAQHYVNTLKPYEEFMHKPEKGTFNKFEAWEKENPKSTFKAFMEENRVSSIKACKESQLNTFAQINEVAKTVTPEIGEKFAQLTENYAKMPTETEEAMKNIRKSMIADIKDSKSKIEDEEKYKQLQKLADSLPTSKNSADAFIVKYAGQPSSKVGARLLKLSVGTIEHVKPQANGGRDRVENYLLECGECNHTRGDVSLHDWVEAHPEMKENTQKYMDEVIEKINNGELSPELDNYPNAVKGALKEQSKGSLTYDTSALKPKENQRPTKNDKSEKSEKPQKPNKPNKPHHKPHRLNIAA